MTGPDPHEQAEQGPGVFGLPEIPHEASVTLIPAPFDATTSYRPGARWGPEAIRRASPQLDLIDARFGEVWRHGLFMQPIDDAMVALSERVRHAADRIYEGSSADEAFDLRLLEEAGEQVRSAVRERVAAAMSVGSIPGVVGGEHSVSLGAIEACAARGPMGVLQIDAHLDLYPAYFGMRWSHASVMRNALELVENVRSIVVVGARDASAKEWAFAEEDPRVSVFADHALADERFRGGTWAEQVARIIDALPECVYVSVDIDGLEPSLCPNTGTPVPGGLSFEQFSYLLERTAQSGRRIVGFDLVEVSPGCALVEQDSLDAIVGARVLYRLCGAAMTARTDEPAQK